MIRKWTYFVLTGKKVNFWTYFRLLKQGRLFKNGLSLDLAISISMKDSQLFYHHRYLLPPQVLF